MRASLFLSFLCCWQFAKQRGIKGRGEYVKSLLVQTRKTKQKVTTPREVGVTLELILFTSGIFNILKQLLSIFFPEVFNAGSSVQIKFL